ncbi:MAG TPA: replicative DNA helicase [Egibacteraceae bacterium]|nr:replicative DNA helicase [Egibacteraceae bacterium]
MAAEPQYIGAPSPAAATERYDRIPPHNLDAEVSVVGSMLLSKNAIAEVGELVGPEDFYRGAHRTMFEAIRALYERGEPVDAVTLADELERRGKLDDVGGAVAIADILQRVPMAANALHYARIVAEQALRRRLIDAGTSIARLGYDPADGVNEAVDAAEALVYQVAQRGRLRDFVAMKDLLLASFERIERLHEQRSPITGLATGFVEFDEVTAGLQPGNLVVVAARPAMGKSTWVTNVATHITVEQRRPVVLFSLEMSQLELVDRMLAAQARVDFDRLRTGRLADSDWPKLSQAMGRLAEAPLYIDETPGINLMEVRSRSRRLKHKHGLDLVIVDYMQLMQPHRRAENRVQEVSELSRGLKILAKELDIPVVALSQLSRKPEDRTDRRPQLADLRESGCLPADARVWRADTGTEVTMGRLHASGRRNLPVWSVDASHRLVAGIMTHVFPTGTKPVFVVDLASGRQLKASANHPLLTPGGWCRVDALVAGSAVAVPGRVPDPVRSATLRPAGVPLVARGGGDGAARAGPDRAAGVATSADLDWDAVVAVAEVGVQPVFDATVVPTHNFVANDVVVSNSIEQDADIVGFIYRDEVYNPDTPAKGEAELIVAKHRNGPLRTVRLSFIGHQARFANMARGPLPGAPSRPAPPGSGPL